jgi:signal transduction histidine kinase
VVKRGVRLDEHDGGAGLGLAIVQDVLDAYGWVLRLDRSPNLGGLRASILTRRALGAPASLAIAP